MNERNNEGVFVSDLVDKAIRFYEQLSNGLVSKLRYDLPALCEVSEGGGCFTGFLNKCRRVELGVPGNVFSGSLKIVPPRTSLDYFSSHLAIRFSISSCGMTLPLLIASRPRSIF